MVKIMKKDMLNDTVFRLVLDAPLIAKKAKAGQFVILRVCEEGERIPLTISDYDRAQGTLSIVVQIVGATTLLLSKKQAGDTLESVVGPLGRPSDTAGLKKVCVIGGGVGCAIAYPIAKAFFEDGAKVDAIIGFRTQSLVIFENEFKAIPARTYLMTDDGTAGEQGFVTQKLKALLDAGEKYDVVFAVGPLPMMKFVAQVTKEYGVKTIVSMNPIMIDGTGMCGGCRLTVGGKMKFACIDGPDFDAHEVDFDETIARSRMYDSFEKHAYEETCNLFKGGDR